MYVNKSLASRPGCCSSTTTCTFKTCLTEGVWKHTHRHMPLSHAVGQLPHPHSSLSLSLLLPFFDASTTPYTHTLDEDSLLPGTHMRCMTRESSLVKIVANTQICVQERVRENTSSWQRGSIWLRQNERVKDCLSESVRRGERERLTGKPAKSSVLHFCVFIVT